MASCDVIVKVNKGSGDQKRRKIIRKLVDKMYIDDEGAMGK